MAQSDARFGYQANLNREVFDLSRPFGFTCAPGMLLPVFKDLCSAGDSYYIKHDLTYLRTLPLLAPAMIDVKVHFESFFVPFQMIYQPFENTFFGLQPILSSFYNQNSFMSYAFPLFDFGAYCSSLIGSYATNVARANAFRLADMFGLNPFNFCEDWVQFGITTWKYTPKFFPWQILAYNTIFYNYYMLDDKDQFQNVYCNWDQYYNTASVSPGWYKFMTVFQRPWDFDYFSSMYRSPIVSDVNLQQILPSAAYSDLTTKNTTRLQLAEAPGSANSIVTRFTSAISITPPSNTDVSGAISTAMIRQMFSNEKLAMITGRTKKNYDSQVLAHYGVNVPHDVKHDITLIGRDTYELNVGEVTSLATTSDSVLGDLAGKGWASSPRDVREHKFTAPCHGVIMTIFSVEPKKRYFGGIDRINMLQDAFDLPISEFDRNGNVPMYRYETGSGAVSSTDPTALLVTDIIGWKERYYQYKRSIPRTTVAFAPDANPSTVIQPSNNYASYFISLRPFEDTLGGNGVRPDLVDRFYINPGCMNSLFGVSWFNGYKRVNYVDGTETGESWDVNPHLLYARDPFIVDIYPKVKKVSWMSKDGEPIYPF